MNYKLTLLQFFASRFLIINYNQKKDGVIIAVCGAGKTEMCFPIISRLVSDYKIAFAIPRIDICNDIYERLIVEFSSDVVGIVTGSKKYNTSANILVLTTNQLLKYNDYFNLIIIDEVDAFPFDVDPKFYNGVTNCLCDGAIFYLTSTPSNRLSAMQLPTFTIYKRWHNYPLPVPKLVYLKQYNKLSKKVRKIIVNRSRKLLVFVATIKKGRELSNTLSMQKINHELTYSTHPRRNQILKKWKQSNDQILISTTILERGVTFDDIDVIVIDCDDRFYNKAALVQIAGRVRRKINLQDGEVYFCYSKYTTTIDTSIKFIKQNNKLI